MRVGVRAGLRRRRANSGTRQAKWGGVREGWGPGKGGWGVSCRGRGKRRGDSRRNRRRGAGWGRWGGGGTLPHSLSLCFWVQGAGWGRGEARGLGPQAFGLSFELCVWEFVRAEGVRVGCADYLTAQGAAGRSREVGPGAGAGLWRGLGCGEVRGTRNVGEDKIPDRRGCKSGGDMGRVWAGLLGRGGERWKPVETEKNDIPHPVLQKQQVPASLYLQRAP